MEEDGLVSRPYLCVVCCAAFALSGLGMDAASLARLSEADRQQVNAWLSKRAESVLEARRAEEELQRAWADESYRSSEVDALRARYRATQQELNRLQREIQRQAEATPAGQAKKRKIEELRSGVAELDKKIAEKAEK